MTYLEETMQEKLCLFLQTRLLNGHAVSADENLLLTGLLDSIAVMELVAHVEELANMPIPPEDILLENFESVTAICNYVKDRRAK